MACTGRIFLPAGKEQTLNFIYISDLINALLTAGQKEKVLFQDYFIVHPEILSWKEFAIKIAEKTGRSPSFFSIPDFLICFMGFLSEIKVKLTGKVSIINLDKINEMKALNWAAKSDKFIEDTGFQYQYPAEKGIEFTLNWYKENHWL